MFIGDLRTKILYPKEDEERLKIAIEVLEEIYDGLNKACTGTEMEQSWLEDALFLLRKVKKGEAI